MLPSLQLLSLSSNQITDEGCAALASALRSGALPALNSIGGLMDNPASEGAQNAVHVLIFALLLTRLRFFWRDRARNQTLCLEIAWPRVQSRRCCAQ